MIYFLLAPLLTINGILIGTAVIPAALLMVKVYHSDRLEKESSGIIWNMITAGVLSTLLALFEERAGAFVISLFAQEGSVLYNVLLYFGVVACAEESSKYILMKKRSWNSREFNCQYDGLVYAVFTSLGFALWENIEYVLSFGFGTAIIRAVTAIPGHACFGVFMGVFYGAAKKWSNAGYEDRSKICRVLAVIVPVLLHGAYDYIATMGGGGATVIFLVFIAILFTISFIVVKNASKTDRYIA